jgi:RNA polymerase sigma-70 factor, ECF subfamily
MRSDRELIESLSSAALADEAFEVLYERHQAALRWHVLRMVRNAAEAQDLVQETFLRVWQRSDQWDGRGAFRSWLLRIGTNVTLNHLRARKRRPQEPLERLLPTHDAEGDDAYVPAWLVDSAALGPHAALEYNELRRTVQGLIQELPDERRGVFQRIHEAGMSVREVAQDLGIPEGTVKSRLHYARRHLATRWDQTRATWEVDE